ncbi:aldehyde dehydrogenase family protein [Massilia cavernae]|uniref:Aldehyde dehydrogenase family protein n=1 Tax=Massilia cavernae TaxID=2320864 RepID=A0A418XGV4_9BURK|nr:aldehyde dehydrogenase family protein [Massilia cavernae]RJG11677.1 aldehyde dehydrogenase family protein [Massilia cavernae]
MYFDPNAVRIPNGHFIDGRLIQENGNTLIVRRPADNAIVAELPIANANTVDQAVQNATQAYETTEWSMGAPRIRARLLRRWADLIEANKVALGQLEAVTSTRPVRDVIEIDIPYAADCIRFFAEFADKLGGEVAATRADHLGMVTSEPYGVVAAIAPWNFPITQAITKIAPALAAGNAVVLKPSEMTPFSALALAELAIEAGIPTGIFNIVQGTGAVTGDLLCRHPMVGKISFTGSTRTGEAIMTASAQSGIKPVTLELGGKSPQLVFSDVPDLDRVARAIAASFLNNAGQVCVAGSRLIVQRSIEAPLLDRIIALTKAIRPGPTWATTTTYSPLISHPHMERIDGIVKRAIAGGASVLTGGGRLSTVDDGAYYQPTILSGVRSESEAVREEIFGPVLTVQSFDDEDDGLALTDHKYGLAAGVYTGNINRALRARRRIQAGTIWVNRYGRSADFIIPTGGYNNSGIGKDLGRQAVEANLRHKSTLIAFDE